MSAPTSKGGDTPKRLPRAAKPKPVPAAEFTAEQLRIARDFAAMDDRAQCLMLRRMETMARNYPRRTRPALRLVGGAFDADQAEQHISGAGPSRRGNR